MALPQRIVVLSFEGPDHYSSIGSLSTRVSQLARSFGVAGCIVDLVFVGDPAAAAVEAYGPNVTLRRWSQWISSSYPRNAYDGEEQKVLDWESSIPGFVVDSIVVPASIAGERTLVIAEEWQTARVVIAIDRLARLRGVRGRFTLMWNANSTFGWERIDWPALQAAAAITVVSKSLKGGLHRLGISSLLIPNGIDIRLHDLADPRLLSEMKQALAGRPTFVKVGRFDPDGHWIRAIDAIAELHASGINARLIMRGRYNTYTERVCAHAYERGLSLERLAYEGADGHKLISAIALSDSAIIYLRAFLDEPTLSALYAASDAVLARSGREPFGLVGLEVIAAGGIVVCGPTDEEYAESFVNAIVCDTTDGRELAIYLRALLANPSVADEMRRFGTETAERYSWSHVLSMLELKVEYVDAVMS
jgi:glycosyltransferase involved in cell wall biosynthesis